MTDYILLVIAALLALDYLENGTLSRPLRKWLRRAIDRIGARRATR